MNSTKTTSLKVLTPGQHAEHAGGPYCHIPCYAGQFLIAHGAYLNKDILINMIPTSTFWTQVIWPWFDNRVTQVHDKIQPTLKHHL